MCTVLIVSFVVINRVWIGWMEAASRGFGMEGRFVRVYIDIVSTETERASR
jgi:hypothetical protein